MTLNGHFTLHFHYYEQRFQKLSYILTAEPIYRIFCITWPEKMCESGCRESQNIWDPRKDCGSFVDEMLRVLHCRNLEKYKANVIIQSFRLSKFPVTPKHVTLNDIEWLFCVKFCFGAGVSGALKFGFRSLATLKLVVNVVDELFKPKRTAAASRGFIATSRLSCNYMPSKLND